MITEPIKASASESFKYEAGYPQYFRKENRCIKVVSPTKIYEVQVPLHGQRLPTIHTPVTFPSKERLDEHIATMEPTDLETYESYLFTLFQATEQNREQLNNNRAQRTQLDSRLTTQD